MFATLLDYFKGFFLIKQKHNPDFEFNCNEGCHYAILAAVKLMLPSSTVAKNGDVCISILHEPGEDKFGYEKPEERWLPIHTVETIMISVISMLADPNSDSPANVDAAVSHTSYPKMLFFFLLLSGQFKSIEDVH